MILDTLNFNISDIWDWEKTCERFFNEETCNKFSLEYPINYAVITGITLVTLTVLYATCRKGKNIENRVSKEPPESTGEKPKEGTTQMSVGEFKKIRKQQQDSQSNSFQAEKGEDGSFYLYKLNTRGNSVIKTKVSEQEYLEFKKKEQEKDWG